MIRSCLSIRLEVCTFRVEAKVDLDSNETPLKYHPLVIITSRKFHHYNAAVVPIVQYSFPSISHAHCRGPEGRNSSSRNYKVHVGRATHNIRGQCSQTWALHDVKDRELGCSLTEEHVANFDRNKRVNSLR